MRIITLATVLGIVAAACSSTAPTTSTEATATSTTLDAPLPIAAGELIAASDEESRSAFGGRFPPPPPVPDGPLDADTRAAIDEALDGLETVLTTGPLGRLAEGGDPRVSWLIVDLMRFLDVNANAVLMREFEDVTGVDVSGGVPWRTVADHLIAWDLPAFPSYQEVKGRLYTFVEPKWAPFFEDDGADVDWRHVSWGGVFIDDRVDESDSCGIRGCIPALDDPGVTDAAGGDWYPDDRIVFGVVIDGEARAYPKHIMEVHEMTNDTLGGRRFAMPYCTLCGSAQAYFTDNVDGFEPVLRTSGLLIRSNKMMYDLTTFSLVDTFTGRATSGPLREAGVELEQLPVVVSTWGDWKAAHPDTTIVAEDGGIGRDYPDDPLRGRDDDGPIFPVGDVDPRLDVQEQVLGVIAADGTPIAFPVAQLTFATRAGERVVVDDVEIVPDGGGFRALVNGEEAPSHQAFWFAWSQFHPETLLWARGDSP